MVVVRFVSGSRKRKPVLRNKNPVLRKQEEPVLRKRKRVRDEDARFRNDFISRLSDDILHQILSFLPTKDLVRTSVLSTRWRDVWNFFPVVDIELGSKEMHELRTGFRALMEREMLNPSFVRIRKFCLNLTSTPTADVSDIMLWMDKVMEHKVQELDLALPQQTFYRLPDQLFSSNSLTKLKLEMDCELMIPDSVCFPRLKILRLSGLKFSSVRPTEKLFSSCPVLEDLTLRVCSWGRISSIVIYIPSLRTLSIGYFPFEDLPDTKIMISAPNLVSFKCVSHEPMDLVLLCNQSSLEDASIDVLDEEFYNPESSLQRTVKLLHGIQGVKFLTLLSYTVKALSVDKGLHDILPSFDNLKDLDVCPSNERCSRALIEILRKTPHLYFLSVESQGPDPEPNAAFSKEDGVLNVIPQCFKTSLERFQFNWFHGNVAEVRLLKYLLENATLLLSMFIWYSDHLSADRIEEIRSELESSRGAATNCEIFFELAQ